MFKHVAVVMVAIVASCFASPAQAQMPIPQIEMTNAPQEPHAIEIYPDSEIGTPASETWMNYVGHGYVVRNVTRPTLTPFLPKPGTETGTAVIVAPGGAFMLLAIEPEGWKVAQALADRGIAAFVLKYRVMPTPVPIDEANAYMDKKVREGVSDPLRQPTIQFPPSTDDALAALQLIRTRAKQWNIDPDRVGMIGFSAGAMTSLNTVLASHADNGPDFIGYIYGPQPAVVVPPHAPPMFAAIAFNDEFFPTQGFPIVEAWHKAGKAVELHAYGKGGHGFGSGRPGTTSTLVLDEFALWLEMEGLLDRPELPCGDEC